MNENFVTNLSMYSMSNYDIIWNQIRIYKYFNIETHPIQQLYCKYSSQKHSYVYLWFFVRKLTKYLDTKFPKIANYGWFERELSKNAMLNNLYFDDYEMFTTIYENLCYEIFEPKQISLYPFKIPIYFYNHR